MRLTTIGHSLVHMRQWLFFREVAVQGHDVLMLAPNRWFHHTMDSHVAGTLKVLALLVANMGDIYHFALPGARAELQKFNADWLYVMQEAQSDLAQWAASWNCNVKKAMFVWENIQQPDPKAAQALASYDLVVCGNGEAEEIARPYARKTTTLPQVGIDTDLFSPRVVPKEVEVAFLGRPLPEKGVNYLTLAWPQARILPWANYEELPQRYSQAKLVVCYSHDTPHWKEQAPPYVAIEALSCGIPVIVSNTASSVFWLTGCPGVQFVPQHSPMKLREAIENVLRFGAPSGREWIVERFSNPVIARRLVECLESRSG